MAGTNGKATLQLVMLGQTYKLEVVTMPNLCCDVLLGQDTLTKHAEVTF